MTLPDIDNTPAKGISYFTPEQSIPAGTAASPQSTGKQPPGLFKPLTIRGVTFQNRLGVSSINPTDSTSYPFFRMLAPLCQYSAKDGHMTDWHLAHLGGIAQRGPGMLMAEATAVVPEGRITPWDTGLWKDSQIEPLRRVIEFVHSQNQKIGVQLAHAGRKASCISPWMSGGVIATEKVGGWPNGVKGPSDVPFSPTFPKPTAMTLGDIEELKSAWVKAAKRAILAGADFVEIHNAHGYLLSSFLAPYSNKRTDQYGGSFENRIRLSLEISQLLRDALGPEVPIFLRVSANDWLNETPEAERWTPDDTVRFAKALADQGAIDLIDISSGGMHAQAKVKPGPGFQVPFATAVKKAVGDKLAVAAVGAILNGQQANQIIENDGLDVVLVGRGFQKDPGLTWTFAQQLGTEIGMANQIRWGFTRRGASDYIDPSVYPLSIF